MDIYEKIGNIASQYGFDGIEGVHIEIFSQRKIIVEGCFGINEYNENLIRINMPKGEIFVFGRDLEIKNMENKNITIVGLLNSVEFSGE